jgi:hypothetical protein
MKRLAVNGALRGADERLAVCLWLDTQRMLQEGMDKIDDRMICIKLDYSRGHNTGRIAESLKMCSLVSDTKFSR